MTYGWSRHRRGGHHHCSLFKCPSGWYGVLSASWYSLGIAMEERSAASTPPVNDAGAGLFLPWPCASRQYLYTICSLSIKDTSRLLFYHVQHAAPINPLWLAWSKALKLSWRLVQTLGSSPFIFPSMWLWSLSSAIWRPARYPQRHIFPFIGLLWALWW